MGLPADCPVRSARRSTARDMPKARIATGRNAAVPAGGDQRVLQTRYRQAAGATAMRRSCARPASASWTLEKSADRHARRIGCRPHTAFDAGFTGMPNLLKARRAIHAHDAPDGTARDGGANAWLIARDEIVQSSISPDVRAAAEPWSSGPRGALCLPRIRFLQAARS